MSIDWIGHKVFITGGAGFLGKHLVEALYDYCDIVVYSRDEAKHYFLKKRFPKIKTIIGDVRDLDSMRNAAKGCNRGIFTASLKQIEACDENPLEASRTIINGSFNSRRICEEFEFESGVFISTDKSRAPTTIYGAMKFVAGESFILNTENSKTNLSTLVYGNVLNSAGSIIPLIWDSIKANRELTLYSEEMTRFALTAQDAVELVLLSPSFNGVNIVPVAKSFKIKDLFEIYKEKFGLKYKIGLPRIGEKIHEVMVAKEEVPRVFEYRNNGIDIFYIDPREINKNPVKFKNDEFSSRDVVISKESLESILADSSFFKPELM